MEQSGQWTDTFYDACCLMGARHKRHNLLEVAQWPPLECHLPHHPQEWQPWESGGRTVFPSKEEAEYTAPLAFMMATSASWWAVRLGFAKLKVPRGPPIQCGSWLDIDPRAFREWAMAPLAITLELRPIDPQSVLGSLTARKCLRAWAPTRPFTGTLDDPFVPGQNCGADEWMALYTEHIMSNKCLG